jgi:phosphoribosylaminoimidazole carboxylase
MLVEAGHRLNIKTVILDAPNAPAKQINALHGHIAGSFNDPVKIRELAKECDVLTYEIEHVDADVLEELERDRENKIEVHPHARTVRVIQDKYLQKEHLLREGVPTAESCPVESGPNCVNRLKEVGKKYGYPFMLKARTLAYDGRGNFKVKHERDIPEAIEFLGDRPLYAEKYAHFVKELAVMVVRTRHGRTHAYPCVETVHENNICKLVFVPARVSDSIKSKARYFAEQAVDGFWGGGVFGVEMFLLENGKPLRSHRPVLSSDLLE